MTIILLVKSSAILSANLVPFCTDIHVASDFIRGDFLL